MRSSLDTKSCNSTSTYFYINCLAIISQELELKNAQLKAENAEIRTKKNAELDELEMKLG